MTYENETCEGCLFHDGRSFCNLLKEEEKYRWLLACAGFKPTLECSKVRFLGRLADRFAPEASPSMTAAAVRAAEAWLDYDAGRSSSDPFQCALAEYRRAKAGAAE